MRYIFSFSSSTPNGATQMKHYWTMNFACAVHIEKSLQLLLCNITHEHGTHDCTAFPFFRAFDICEWCIIFLYVSFELSWRAHTYIHIHWHTRWENDDLLSSLPKTLPGYDDKCGAHVCVAQIGHMEHIRVVWATTTCMKRQQQKPLKNTCKNYRAPHGEKKETDHKNPLENR